MAGKQKTTPGLGEVMNRETLEQFTHIELITYARLQYDLKLNKDSNAREEVIEMILNAARRFKGNAEMRTVAMDDKSAIPMGMVKVRVSPGPHNPNARPIIVGLNFQMASIPCNRDTIMDEKWLTCLQDAVRTNYRVGYDEATGKDGLQWTEEHQYPFSVVDRGPARPKPKQPKKTAKELAAEAVVATEIAEAAAAAEALAK
jgi:hypothetical protein